MINVILLGPPGVGKGTQSALLAGHIDGVHISTGELLRKEMEQQTPLGIEIKQLMDSGQYVSDTIACGLVERSIDPLRGIVLDGFPRTIPQAETLQKIFLAQSRTLNCVIELQADRETLIQRMLSRAAQSNRADDNEETFRHRLETYDAKTAPLIDFYSQLGLLSTVDSMADIPVVQERILQVLDEMVHLPRSNS